MDTKLMGIYCIDAPAYPPIRNSYSTVADWDGAGCWGRELVQNYVRMNQTATIAWSLIWAVYDSLPYYGNGLMYAMEPWTGH